MTRQREEYERRKLAQQLEEHSECVNEMSTIRRSTSLMHEVFRETERLHQSVSTNANSGMEPPALLPKCSVMAGADDMPQAAPLCESDLRAQRQGLQQVLSEQHSQFQASKESYEREKSSGATTSAARLSSPKPFPPISVNGTAGAGNAVSFLAVPGESKMHGDEEKVATRPGTAAVSTAGKNRC